MWSIGEVKRNGWSNLKNYYWAAFFVTLITGLFTGGVGGNAGRKASQSNVNINDVTSGIQDAPTGIYDAAQNSSFMTSFLFSSIFITVLLTIFLVTMLVKLLIGNAIAVGSCRFYMESRALKRSAGVGRIFWVFKSGSYWNVVKIMFLRDLYTLLWSLLLIIPGIIKAYEYIQIPYILSENPDADVRDVFALTKEMMSGSKFDYFLLGLSFIGWMLLGVITWGIALIFVAPYCEASYAEVYAAYRKQTGGFPFKGYGVEEEQSVYEQVGGDDYHAEY